MHARMLHPHISREGASKDMKALRPSCNSALSTWSHGLYLRHFYLELLHVSKDGPYAMHYGLANHWECTGKCCWIDPDLLQLVNPTLASSPLTVTLWWDEWYIYYSAIRGGNGKYNCYNPEIRPEVYVTAHRILTAIDYAVMNLVPNTNQILIACKFQWQD